MSDRAKRALGPGADGDLTAKGLANTVPDAVPATTAPAAKAEPQDKTEKEN